MKVILIEFHLTIITYLLIDKQEIVLKVQLKK